MTKKIVVFGDSITAGWINGETSPILSDLMQENLKHMGVLNTETILKGVPSEDTFGGLKRMDEVTELHPDIVVIFFGANDAAAHHDVSPLEFKQNLLTMAETFKDSRVIFVTPPYYNEEVHDDRRSNKAVLEYRKETFAAADELSTPVVDIYQHMTIYPAPNEFLQADGVHFSVDGYELLASLIAAKIRDLK
jgi:lysophospholipase L1-like esterase